MLNQSVMKQFCILIFCMKQSRLKTWNYTINLGVNMKHLANELTLSLFGLRITGTILTNLKPVTSNL